jgi:predicted secreted protein
MMAGLCFSVPAAAQSAAPCFLKEGQTLLNISATERTTVDQDTVVATLRVEKENKDASDLQDEINEMMQGAVKKVKSVQDVEVETQQYYVYEQYNYPHPVRSEEDRQKREETKTWRGSQSLTLESKNAENLLDLAGELQSDGFLMNGLNYKLSTEKQEEVRESLMEAALEKLRARAERAATALGRETVEMIEVNIDAAPSFNPQPMVRGKMEMMAMSADASGAPPVAEPGKNDIEMTVSAKAVLE